MVVSCGALGLYYHWTAADPQGMGESVFPWKVYCHKETHDTQKLVSFCRSIVHTRHRQFDVLHSVVLAGLGPDSDARHVGDHSGESARSGKRHQRCRGLDQLFHCHQGNNTFSAQQTSCSCIWIKKRVFTDNTI